MTLRDTLCLSRAGKPVREFPLGEAAVEVGSHPDCDIVLHTLGVAPRSQLIQPLGGTVYAYDLVRAPGLGERALLPVGGRLALGGGYSLTRRKAECPSFDEGTTELIDTRLAGMSDISLVRGTGTEARAVRLRDEPLSLGVAPDNAIELSDRAVSRYHCRLEPSSSGAIVRDLGSTNGTWVDGLRVRRLQLLPGARLRVGRTEIRVVRSASLGQSPPDLVVASAPMLSVMADVDRFAQLPWPVLIRGETGVGKEHVARELHERGPRRNGPFVALNGGGLARELIESELFGHERGAFTGAVQAHRGAFEQAHRGTLFLDEVAELPADLQTRLLRVLETWTVRRIGAEAARAVDVRLLCATHRDLRAMCQEGRFRFDLYYRIHRLLVEVPPLRHRRDDVEPLALHFLDRMQAELGPRLLTSSAVERLRYHPWPGNVRELRNVLEVAAVDCNGVSIGLASVERALRRCCEPAMLRPSADSLREALEQYGGNLSAAARALGIPRSTLRDRLKGA